MEKFTSITSFGGLTVNGQKLKFEDFDKNNDGMISETEYSEVLKTTKLDSLELSTVDDNNDKKVSQREFNIWEQKILMQDAVNSLANQISQDFSGKSQYLEQLTEELKTLINDYAKTYNGDISKMAEDFSLELPEKYKTIKNSILANDPSNISAKVIYEMSLELSQISYNGQLLANEALTRMITELNTISTKFIQNYKGSDFEYDLKMYLEAYLNNSDATIMQKSYEEFKNNIDSLDENADLKTVKEQVKNLLITAQENLVKIKLGGLNLLTENAINAALNQFTDKNELLDAIEEILSSLNTKSRKELILEEEAEKAKALVEQRFMAISGSNYQINTSVINFSTIEGYMENSQIYERGKGWSGSKDKAWENGVNKLTQDSFKTQIKSQIESMLRNQGYDFSRVEAIFENVYAQSVYETLSSDGMITGRGARGLSSKGKAYINIKDMVDKFIEKFNTNIETAINSFNISNKDFDIADFNYQDLNSDNGNNYHDWYNKGKNLTQKGWGSNFYEPLAHDVLDNLKEQLLEKAKNTCKNNGLEFDSNEFNNIFDKSKEAATQNAITGKGEKIWKLVGGSALLGKTGGWIAANKWGVSSSSCTLDVRKLVDSFLIQFKYNFTNYIEGKDV